MAGHYALVKVGLAELSSLIVTDKELCLVHPFTKVFTDLNFKPCVLVHICSLTTQDAKVCEFEAS